MDGLEVYKRFVDKMVEVQRNNVTARWIEETGYPKLKENEKVNEFLCSLSKEQRSLLAKIVGEAKRERIHDALAAINEMVNLDGLEIYQDGKKMICDHFESMHFDFICRCEGDEWPAD